MYRLYVHMLLKKNTLQYHTANKGHKIIALCLYNASIGCIGYLIVVLSVGESENMLIMSYGLKQNLKTKTKNTLSESKLAL